MMSLDGCHVHFRYRNWSFQARTTPNTSCGLGKGCAIGRLDRQGKAKVRGGVLVAAKYVRLGRQVPQAVQRCIHLLRITFKHPATTRAKQRIAAKKRAMAPKCDVTHRMPRHL